MCHYAMSESKMMSVQLLNLMQNRTENYNEHENTHHLLCKIQQLLHAGADPDAVDTIGGRSCLHYTALLNCEQTAGDIAALLISAGATVDVIANNGDTPLLLAAKTRNENRVLIEKLLAADGININQTDSRNWTTLHWAVYLRKTEVVHMLLDAKALPNIIDDRGNTPLLLGANYNADNQDLMKTLIFANGVNVDLQDSDGMSSLHYAAQLGKVEITRFLLSAGASTKLLNNKKHIPLISLITNLRNSNEQHRDITQQLISSGVCINAGDADGRTSFHHACKQGDREMAHFLLTVGATPTLLDKKGYNALFLGVMSQNTELVRYLVDVGLDVNWNIVKGFLDNHCATTALELAVLQGDDEMVQCLLECGANITGTKGLDTNLLSFALENSSPSASMMKLLLSHGVDMYSGGAKNSRSPFEFLVSDYGCGRFSRAAEVRVFFEHGLNLRRCNPRSPKDFSPLHKVVTKRNIEMLSLLLEYNTNGSLNIEHLDESGCSPLHVAVKEGFPDCVKLLLKSGANINQISSDGVTPIALASLGTFPDQERTISMIKLLLSHGANIYGSGARNSRSPFELLLTTSEPKRLCRVPETRVLFEHGLDLSTYNPRSPKDFSPLHKAVTKGNIEMLSLLLEYNTNGSLNIEHLDESGCSPLHVAVKEGFPDCVKLLLKSGANINQISSDGVTPIALASLGTFPDQERTISMIKLLLSHGANIYGSGVSNSRSPFEILLTTSTPERLCRVPETRVLFEHGLDLSTYNPRSPKDFSPLHEVVTKGDIEMLSLLLEYNTNGSLNIEHKNSYGHSPLYVAVSKKFPDCVKLLLKSGASIPDSDLIDSQGRTLLELAAFEISSDEKDVLPIMELLLSHGADAYATTQSDSKSIFQRLVSSYRVAETRLLLEHGLDLSRYSPRTPMEFSPLHAARRSDILSLLLEYNSGGVLNLEHVNERGQTPLFEAVESDAIDCVKILLEKGVNVDHTDSQGRTPLILSSTQNLASSESRKKCIQSLIGAGAKLREILGMLLPDDQVDHISDNSQDWRMLYRQCDDPINCLETAKHIAKYRVLYESGKSSNAESMEQGNMGKSAKLLSYYEACKTEITLLKNSLIHDSISAHDVLIASEDFHKCVRHDGLYRKMIDTRLDRRFPIYAKDLSEQFRRLKLMHCIWERAVSELGQQLAQFFCPDTYYPIVRDILNHLQERELQVLAGFDKLDAMYSFYLKFKL